MTNGADKNPVQSSTLAAGASDRRAAGWGGPGGGERENLFINSQVHVAAS